MLWDITAERTLDLKEPDKPMALHLQIWAESELEARQAAQADISASDPEFWALRPTLLVRTWDDAHRN